jgi:hypothetical protein
MYSSKYWVDQDLTALSKTAPQVANGSALSSFTDNYGEHVVYIGTDLHVHKLMFSRKYWVDQDLTKLANGLQATGGLTSFTDNHGEHIPYISADQHIHQLIYNANKWTDQDLTDWARTAPQVASGSASLSSFTDNYGEHVVYIGADQHVHKLMYSSKYWVDQDLTTLALPSRLRVTLRCVRLQTVSVNMPITSVPTRT